MLDVNRIIGALFPVLIIGIQCFDATSENLPEKETTRTFKCLKRKQTRFGLSSEFIAKDKGMMPGLPLITISYFI